MSREWVLCHMCERNGSCEMWERTGVYLLPVSQLRKERFPALMSTSWKTSCFFFVKV